MIVETPYSKRASELFNLYTSMQKNQENIEDRISVLDSVKNIVYVIRKEDELETQNNILTNKKNIIREKDKCCDEEVVRELLSLVERERDLLLRGRSKHMEQLRARQNHLFFLYLSRPQNNPAIDLPQRREPRGIIP